MQRNLKPAQADCPTGQSAERKCSESPCQTVGTFTFRIGDTYGFITTMCNVSYTWEFDRLIPYQYHIIVGRKGKTLEFTISFDRADFHHLTGLHKLRDNVRLQTGKRSDIMKEILDERLTYSDIKQSSFFHEMESRLLRFRSWNFFWTATKLFSDTMPKQIFFLLSRLTISCKMIMKGHPFICFSRSVLAVTHRYAAHSSQKLEKIMQKDSRGIHCSKKKNII